MSCAGDIIAERFPHFVVSHYHEHSDETLVITREGLIEILTSLRDELDFRMPLDITCVDRLLLFERPAERTPPIAPGHSTLDPLPKKGSVRPRFEVVYHLRSLSRRAVIRLKVMVDEDDPVIPSATAIFKGFLWFEREVFDMFGIRFYGHPDLRRILLYPEFKGHPLRKDYPRRGYQPLVEMPRLRGDSISGDER